MSRMTVMTCLGTGYPIMWYNRKFILFFILFFRDERFREVHQWFRAISSDQTLSSFGRPELFVG